MPTIVLFLIAPLGLPQVQERKVVIPVVDAPLIGAPNFQFLELSPGTKPATPVIPDYLASADCKFLFAQLWGKRNHGEDISEVLSQAMISPDARVRANALLAFGYSLNWEKRKPEPSRGYFTLADQPVWNILVENMRDDYIHINLRYARNCLFQNFDAARPALKQALRKGDWQMKKEAINLFIHKDFNNRFPELDKVLFDSLRGDIDFDYFDGPRGANYGSSLWWETPWLVHHAAFFYDILKDWLLDGGSEKRSIAALVFANRRWEGYDQQVVEALVSHLRADNRYYNGTMASQALFHLHERALPFLERITDFTDQQQETYLRLLVWDIKNPPTNQHELMQRKVAIPSVTLLCTHCFDPLLEHLGLEYYYPEYCDDAHWKYDSKDHPFWELKKSACPCGGYFCDIRKQDLLGLRE